jgi:ubiquinone/menaquinone biosynthesis C-methylase UbiE
VPFADASFDHVFELLTEPEPEPEPEPEQALAALRRLLKPGGTLTVIEGDHGSIFFHNADSWFLFRRPDLTFLAGCAH